MASFEDYEKGLRCDVLDNGMWRTARVIDHDRSRNRVQISYDGWAHTWDTWVDLRLSPSRIAPLWSKVEKGKYTGDPKNPPDIRYDLAVAEKSAEYEAELKVVEGIKKTLESGTALDEKQTTWLVEGNYVQEMLHAKVTEANWKLPFAFLQKYLIAAVAALKRGLKRKDEESLFGVLKAITGFYSSEDDKLSRIYFDQITGFLRNLKHAGKFASLKTTEDVRGDGESYPPARVLLIDKFGEIGGFDILQARLSKVREDFDEKRSPKQLQGPTFVAMTTVIRILRGIKYILNEDFMINYFKKLSVQESNFLGGVLRSLDRDAVYKVAGKGKAIFDQLLDDLSSIIRGAQGTKTYANKYVELAQLDLILFLIEAPYIVAQRRAMQLISLYLKALNPKKWEKGDQVSAQYKNGTFYRGKISSVNKDGTYNIEFDDGDTEDHLTAAQIRPCVRSEGGGWAGYNQEPEEDPPKLQHLDGEMFIKWLEDNKVIDLISRDLRLFLHSSPIFKFLASAKQLTNAHLDILLSQAKTAEGSELMSQLAEQMDEKTLTAMYKRQTEGIEYADYQPWQLEALTKFTLSAVKATKGSNYYGLNLFWDMLRPENESKLDKEIIQKATACLNQLFESPLLSSKKEGYLDMCVESLTKNEGEVNALTVFQILMKGLTAGETAAKIEDSVERYNLLDLFFKNSITYNESAANALAAKPHEAKGGDGKDAKESKLPQERKLHGNSFHWQQIQSRLSFLRFLGQNSKFTLGSKMVDAIWDLHVTNSVCDNDTESFMQWLPGCLSETKEVFAVFSPESRSHLFEQLASKHVHKRSKKPVKVTPSWQRCFTSCFLSANQASGAIELAPLVILSHAKLKGKDQLWDFALSEPDPSVRFGAQSFLGAMYIKFHLKEMSEAEKIVALNEFISKCLSSLDKSKKGGNKIVMQATLELLGSVLKRINAGEMIKRPLYKKGEKIQAHWKRDGGTLYGATIIAVHEDGTYHVKYNDGDVDPAAPEAYLRETNGQRRIPEPVKLSVVEQHVQTTISKEKQHFDLIFSCLDVGGVISALAWDLLLLLPPSDAVAVRLRGLHTAPKVDWKLILPPAPVKLLYTLQIIDPKKLKDANAHPLQDAKWCEVFGGEGLTRLASILGESAKVLVADNLASQCLATIYDIFIWFLSGTKTPKSVDISKVVDLSLNFVKDLVTPDKDAAKGKAEALASLFRFLSIATRHEPKAFGQIQAFGPQWEDIVVTTLITNKEIMVQKSFTDGIQLLVSSAPDDSKEIQKLRTELQDKLLSVVNSRFAELDTQTNCSQYLLLMRNLIANTVDIEEKSAKEIGISLAQLIRKHPMVEATPKMQDAVLGALLNLTAELIKKVPVLKDSMGSAGPKQTSLLQPVFDMLFMVPTLQNSYHLKIRPPQCKHPNTRRAGFTLLAALASANENNFKKLAEMLIPLHLRIHSNGTKPFSWEFEPAWKSDEQEREGYCGLVNCGNTCFANAALQQVFMQPSLRQNILAVDNYHHPNPSRPEWKRDELEGLQWLLGNLQESNRRAIRPMFFHSRFEDPDWENQGRPVRGEGAAGHAQADSNGFLQTLLGRIEDRIKKTPHEKAIKDVCGLEFVEHIVGSRSAPYLNYDYRSNKWVGPIQINVNGKKTLHDALKGHVEFKQQNRKVSKEGIFGQKYEKQNVPIFTRTVFKTMPQCLMICLNRMSYDNMGNTVKLNHRISFPIKLDMKPYSQEALFSKLPRGTDTGASGPGAETKIKPPPNHPDEYYQYELMGVIVHAGRTLQSGHYYSYIRERPPSKKWYCFNDSSITPFDVSKLEEETFGSADTDSWKCSTAYVLFYDKVPAKKKVNLKNQSKVGFAGAGLLVAKMKAAQKEATEKVKARAAVPKGMLKRIWDENEVKWRDTNVHDRNYGDALYSILSAYQKANPKPPASQPDVDKVTDKPSSMYDQVTRLVTRYLFMTLARSKGRTDRGWAEWVNAVKSMYVGNIGSSVWLLSMVINSKVDWFSTLLMAEHDTSRSAVQEVRQGASEVIAEAMRTLSPLEKRAIAKASASSVKRRVRASTPKRSALDEVKGKTMDEKKGGDIKEPAKPIKEIIPRPNVGFVLPIVDRLLDEIAERSGERSRDKSSDQFHWIRLLEKFSNFGKEELGYLEYTGLFDILVSQVDPHQEMSSASHIDQLPDEYFSLVQRLARSKEKIAQISTQYFLDRLLFEPYSKARAATVCPLICDIIKADPAALDCLLDCVSKGIEKRNHEITRPYYRALTSILADAGDKKTVAAKIMGKLLAAFANDDMKFKEGDFIGEHIIRLAGKFPECKEFLKVAKAGVERALKFLSMTPEEKKIEWTVGDQVFAKFKQERGVYAGDVTVDNGDGTYKIEYDDGDVWEEAPAEKIRRRMFPRLTDDGLEEMGLASQTVKCLQFVLTNQVSTKVSPRLDVTGVMDESTINALMDLIDDRGQRTGELDKEVIKRLQRYLGREYVDKLTTKSSMYHDANARPVQEDGEIGPVTKFYFRRWLDEKVNDISSFHAKKDLAGHTKKFEARREELGFHQQYRRYTITCEFAVYGRPIKEKVKALQSLDMKETDPYDSEDERAERKFSPNTKIDVWDDQEQKWKVGLVHRVKGSRVIIKQEVARHRLEPLVITASAWSDRRSKRTISIAYNVSDPHLEPVVGKYSSLK